MDKYKRLNKSTEKEVARFVLNSDSPPFVNEPKIRFGLSPRENRGRFRLCIDKFYH